MRLPLLAGLVGALLVLTGCATTRSAHFGWLPNREPLVTLIVTEDRDLVRRECAGLVDRGIVVGCQRSRLVALGEAGAVRVVTIVRYTDALPSPLAFEIDGHELCHAIADVQSIPDPCHGDDDGVIQAAVPWSPVRQFLPAR